MRIIFPNSDYSDALRVSGLQTLSERRESVVKDLFNEIKSDTHPLNSLLRHRLNNVSTRNNYPFTLPKLKTDRGRRDFISYCLLTRNTSRCW